MDSQTSDISPNKVLMVLCISSFLVPFMGSALNLAMPEIGRAFSFNAVTLTWMATIYLISTAIFQIPFSRLADMIGRKKIYISGVFIFSVCTLLCGFAPSGNILILLRFFAGMGSAMMFGTGMAILTSVFPKSERGKVFGINTSVVYASLAAGPFLGGMLTHYLGWKSIFFVSAAIGLIVVILSLVYLNGEWAEAKGEKFDIIGSVIYGISLFGLIYGFSNLPHINGIIWLIVGIVGFAGFIFYEMRCDFPVFDVKLFSGNKVFSLSSLAALINYAATSAIAFMLSLYLQYIRGFDARHAGLILISQACVQSIFALLSGRLSDKFQASRLATLGMIIIVFGLLGLTFITDTTPIWFIVILLALLGVGFGIFSSPNTNVIMSSVDKKYYGQASATTGTMRLAGQSFSMGIASMAISLQIGTQKISPQVYPEFMKSLHITFIIFVCLCIVGVFASSVRSKK